MFTIEHDFDATTITLVDDGENAPSQEDVTIHTFDDRVSVQQWDPRTDHVEKITLSMAQVHDLLAALNLPEGIYQRTADSLKGHQP